jgi:hypothetical protein
MVFVPLTCILILFLCPRFVGLFFFKWCPIVLHVLLIPSYIVIFLNA